MTFYLRETNSRDESKVTIVSRYMHYRNETKNNMFIIGLFSKILNKAVYTNFVNLKNKTTKCILNFYVFLALIKRKKQCNFTLRCSDR